jgi:hypothetical protein
MCGFTVKTPLLDTSPPSGHTPDRRYTVSKFDPLAAERKIQERWSAQITMPRHQRKLTRIVEAFMELSQLGIHRSISGASKPSGESGFTRELYDKLAADGCEVHMAITFWEKGSEVPTYSFPGQIGDIGIHGDVTLDPEVFDLDREEGLE